MKRRSRRVFLNSVGNLVRLMLLSGLLSRSGATAVAENSELQETDKSRRVLIVYASYHGSTREIAEYVANQLRGSDFQCDVRSVNDRIGFSKYSDMIMGAPIHRGAWMKPACDFIHDHLDQMKYLSFSCFFTCMAAAVPSGDQENAEELLSYEQSVRLLTKEISPLRVGVFPGKLEYDKCGFMERLIIRMIMKRNNLPAGDHRDWKQLKQWTDEIINLHQLPFSITENRKSKFGVC